MKLQIWQLKKSTDYLFKDFAAAKASNFMLEDYRLVWEENADDQICLEAIYTKFNIAIPAGFRGRYLAASDLVRLGNRWYYCDTDGWTELTKK